MSRPGVVVGTSIRLAAVASGSVLVLLVAAGGASAAAQRAGDWQWPLLTGSGAPPAVVRGFERPLTPYGPGHRGVDLAADVGRPVTAAGSGVVSVAGDVAGRGVVVVVHGELRTTYEPVNPAVAVGARVTRGAQIGTLLGAHPGCRSPGACLHWGLLHGADYLDPLGLLRSGPVRLLPLDSTSSAAPVAQTAVASISRATSPAPPDAPIEPPGPAPASSPVLRLSGRLASAGAFAAASLLVGLLLLRTRASCSLLRGRACPATRRGGWVRRRGRRAREALHRARARHPSGHGPGPMVVDLERVRARRRVVTGCEEQPDDGWSAGR